MLREGCLEVVEGHLQAATQFDLGLPAEELSCLGDVGTAAGGVVLRERLEANLGLGAGDGKNLASALEDGPLVGIADVDGEMFLRARRGAGCRR